MRHIIFAISAALFAVAASAATFHWKDNAQSTDWTDGNNYEEGSAPSAGDTVEVGDTTVKISDSDADSFSLASSLAQIKPTHKDAKIEITIDDTSDTVWVLESMICNESYPNVGQVKGTVHKKGTGKLRLNNATATAYQVNISVDEGTLYLTQAYSSSNYYICHLHVEQGATFYSACRRTYIRGITGTGLVTAASNYAINPFLTSPADDPWACEAQLRTVSLYCSGYGNILRTDNRTGYIGIAGGGVLGVRTFGISGNTDASVGGWGEFRFQEYGGTLLCLGENEETLTDRGIAIWHPKQGECAIDAGAYGGITFSGWMRIGGYASYQGMGMLVLKGSSANENVLSGPFYRSAIYGSNKYTDDGWCFPHIVKRGTGAWRLAGAATLNNGKTNIVNRIYSTGITVEEGTLRFDSIVEKGYKCSLGVATNTMPAYCGDYDESRRVPWAFTLGGQGISYPAANLATFEYTGGMDAECATRPIALVGDACLRNATTNRFRFSGVSSISNGINRLVLDGEGTENELSDVSDGTNATMRTGLVKVGPGTWTLTGTNDFSGPLVVNGGRLVVKRPDDAFKWFRVIVKRTMDDSKDNFKFARIGLFDSKGSQEGYGKRQGVNMKANYQTPAVLAPGEIGYGMPQLYPWGVRSEGAWNIYGCKDLSSTGAAGDNSCVWINGRGLAMTPDDPSTWITFSLRLTNGSPEIVGYDIASLYNHNNGTESYYTYNLRAWELDGSYDGYHWTKLHEIADATDEESEMQLPTNYRYWMKQNKTTDWETANSDFNLSKVVPITARRTGEPIPILNRVEAVTVANGAVLEADGDITLSNFRAAADGTAGTVKGFALAQNCTLDVTGLPERPESFDIPINFDGMSPGDALWSLKVGGNPSTKYGLVTVGDKLRFIVKGMAVSIR